MKVGKPLGGGKKARQSMPLCLTCTGTGPLQRAAGAGELPAWLQRLGRTSAVPPSLSPGRRYRANAKVTVALRHAPCRVFWWAARPRRLAEAADIEGPAEAYGDYPNRGFGHLVANRVTIAFASPRPYAEGRRLWAPHVHFILQDAAGRWAREPVYTVAALPLPRSPSYLFRHLKHQPYSCCVTPTQVYRAMGDRRIRTLSALGAPTAATPLITRPGAAPPLHSDMSKLRRRIGRRPVVVYCMKPTCGAAKAFIRTLLELGVSNIFYMPAGLAGWKRAGYPVAD